MPEGVTTAAQQYTFDLINLIQTENLWELRNTPEALKTYMQARGRGIKDASTEQHSGAYGTVKDHLQQSSNTNNNILYYFTRNKDLNHLQESLEERVKGEALGARHDAQLAKRQFEVNEWTSGNKLDTLFFFQLLFISLMIIAPIFYYHRLGVIPGGAFYGIVALIVLALLLTIIIRARYTEVIRDYRFWNRRRFPTLPAPRPAPICPGFSSDAIAGAQAGITNISNNLSNAAASVGQTVGNAMVNAGAAVQGAT
jgi:hypothetical protein